jgi:hypothetical protein
MKLSEHANLGFLLGGTIDCTSILSINDFINRDINKENLQDAKYRKPLNKHTQSVASSQWLCR